MDRLRSFGTAMPEEWIAKVQEYIALRNEEEDYFRFSTATLLRSAIDHYIDEHPLKQLQLEV